MQTLSVEQFKARYGQAGLDSFGANTNQSQGQPQKLTDIVGQDIANRVQRVGEIQARTDTGQITKAVQTFGQGAGLAANTLEQTVAQVPGVKQVAGGIGSAINWLATSDISPIKHLGDIIGSNKTLQTATHLYNTDKSFKDTIDAVANIARIGGDVQLAVDSANFTANVTNKVIRNIKNTDLSGVPKALEPIKNKVVQLTQNAPGQIMNRVARLNPKDTNTFKKMSGKTEGQYLAETGNFGAPDKIISTEAKKFVNSMNGVDTELAKLPGVYKNGAIRDALTGLKEKAINVSSANVKAPYQAQVSQWIKKYNAGGLSMEDINAVKRLYERKVKLGYNKLINADKVQQATNIDSAVRTWQVAKAKELGFTNIAEMNKQTQISKFLVNKLGEKVIGQSGLNSIGLTDWVMLSGGNPTTVTGFLTKKFFSSKAVQAQIAKLLKSGEIQKPITPIIKGVSTRTTPQPPLSPKKVLKTPSLKIVPKTIVKVNPLTTEALKYKTAEEVRNLVETPEIKSVIKTWENRGNKYSTYQDPALQGMKNVVRVLATLTEEQTFYKAGASLTKHFDEGLAKIGEYLQKIEQSRAHSGYKTVTQSDGYRKLTDFYNKVKSTPKPTPSTIKLTPADKIINDKTSALYDANPQKYLDAYKKLETTEGGKVSNSDLARPLFSDAGYTGTNAMAVQTASKKIAVRNFAENLKNNPEPYGIINVGGSGVGKSSGLKAVDPTTVKNAAAIWDGNSDNFVSLKERILKIVGAGKVAKVPYTFAPIEVAFDRMISRMKNNKSEQGRLVVISEMVNNHVGSLDAMRKVLSDPELVSLIESGKVHPILLDNSGSSLSQIKQLANLDGISYNKPELLAKLRAKAKNLYDTKQITKDQYEAVVQ